MPKLVALPDVLYQVYVFGNLQRTENERPMSYESFKKIMLGSELVVTEKTIRQKYNQIVAAGFAKEARNNPNIIILNVRALINELIYKHEIDAEIIPITSENCGSHTQTHTQTEVSS